MDQSTSVHAVWHSQCCIHVAQSRLCIVAIVVDLFRAPLARYVDDFFGCSRAGVSWTGGAVLTVLSRLLGFMTDPGKDADNMIQMVVLGAELSIDWPRRGVSSRLDPIKATKYSLLGGVS